MKTKIFLTVVFLSTFLLVNPSLAQGVKPSATPGVGRGLKQNSLRACQAREKAVKGEMESLIDLAAKMEKVFDSIATRVKNFYTNKVLPGGKTLSNYNVLVSEIDSKKAIVATDLKAAQDRLNAFSCTGDNPKGLMLQFRLDMQKVKGDLKSYRTSVKNLIVAVRTLSPSPEPSSSPE